MVWNEQIDCCLEYFIHKIIYLFVIASLLERSPSVKKIENPWITPYLTKLTALLSKCFILKKGNIVTING